MFLNKTDKIVRWAYFTYDPDNGHCKAPRLSSLCAIFWRSVLWTPLKLLFPLTVLVAISGIAWIHPKDFFITVGIIAGLLLAVVLIVWVHDQFEDDESTIYLTTNNVKDTIAESVLWQGFKAVKSKACPLVYIEHGTTRNIYQENENE